MMQILILAGSLVAVLILIGLNRLLGGWRDAQMPTDDHAARRYLTDFFDDQIGAILRSSDGKAAILSLKDPDALGLVFAMGDRLVTRRLTKGSLARVDWQPPDKLKLRLRDYSGRPVTMLIATEQQDWLKRLQALIK